MIKTVILSLVSFILTAYSTFGQALIDIAENTLKVLPQGEEIFYYGFAEGDQLIFNFEEVNGKELKEFEIMFMPSKSIFMDYKTNKIEKKILTIAETGIYKFRFKNSNLLAGRICKFKIQRIPVDEISKKFNTTVYERFVYDTTYYDEQERFFLKADTTTSEILSQNVKVHSSTNLNGNKTITNFSLPTNTIAWSYYIGVDQSGEQAYENAVKDIVSKSSPLITRIVGSSPLVALALNLPSFLSKMQKGEEIDFWLVQGQEANLFQNGQQFRSFKNSKVINDFSKLEPIPGNLSFCFSNDNAVNGVVVTVKVVAVQVNTIYGTREVRKMNINSHQEMYLKN